MPQLFRLLSLLPGGPVLFAFAHAPGKGLAGSDPGLTVKRSGGPDTCCPARLVSRGPCKTADGR